LNYLNRFGVNPIHWTVRRAKLECRSSNFCLNRFLRLLSRFSALTGFGSYLGGKTASIFAL
jgi:hypothetical protein